MTYPRLLSWTWTNHVIEYPFAWGFSRIEHTLRIVDN